MPIMNAGSNETAAIAVAKTDIKKGNTITEKDVFFTEKGIFGLEGYITKKEDVIGKPAAVDILKSDFVTTNKIGKENISRLQSIVNDKKSLVTVSVKTNAAGLASHLKSGDMVRLYSVIADEYTGSAVIQNPLLEKIEVYDIENSNTESIESDSKGDAAGSSEMVASTITFIAVSKEQERILLEAEYRGSIHAVFVER